MHVIFPHWLASAMTLVGGFLFASTYRKERSLALCCAEHALYGRLISPPRLDR
jgi:membrane protease YdiL (CAAX protease family)